jgi:hypothetical protein
MSLLVLKLIENKRRICCVVGAGDLLDVARQAPRAVVVQARRPTD